MSASDLDLNNQQKVIDFLKNTLKYSNNDETLKSKKVSSNKILSQDIEKSNSK